MYVHICIYLYVYIYVYVYRILVIQRAQCLENQDVDVFVVVYKRFSMLYINSLLFSFLSITVLYVMYEYFVGSVYICKAFLRYI